MKENQTKTQIKSRKNNTFCWHRECHHSFPSSSTTACRWWFEWIFGETVTHWLNICELHGLWILTVMTFSLFALLIFDGHNLRFAMAWSAMCAQKNMKLAQRTFLLVSGWGRSWTMLPCKCVSSASAMRYVASVHDGRLSVICRIAFSNCVIFISNN